VDCELPGEPEGGIDRAKMSLDQAVVAFTRRAPAGRTDRHNHPAPVSRHLRNAERQQDRRRHPGLATHSQCSTPT
jgi:hypothetical protein